MGEIEIAPAAEERLVPNPVPEHVQHGGALVVDQGPEDPGLAAQVAEAIAEIDRAFARTRQARSLPLGHHIVEDAVAVALACEEASKILCHSLA